AGWLVGGDVGREAVGVEPAPGRRRGLLRHLYGPGRVAFGPAFGRQQLVLGTGGFAGGIGGLGPRVRVVRVGGLVDDAELVNGIDVLAVVGTLGFGVRAQLHLDRPLQILLGKVGALHAGLDV